MALIEFGKVDMGYKLLQILNPARRNKDKNIAQKYMIEPYYIAGDIYSNKDVIGHGGWSIYTGASGWFYKAATETLLGINMKDGNLKLSPKFPSSWNEFSAHIEISNTIIDLSVLRSNKPIKTPLPYHIILDQKHHDIKIEI